MKYRHLIALGLAAFLLAACKPAADEPKAPDADVATPAQPPASDATGLEPPPEADVADKTDMPALQVTTLDGKPYDLADHRDNWRSEEHTSELQSLMRLSSAVFCWKKKI